MAVKFCMVLSNIYFFVMLFVIACSVFCFYFHMCVTNVVYQHSFGYSLCCDQTSLLPPSLLHIAISFVIPDIHSSQLLWLLCSVGGNPFDVDDEEEDFSNVVGVPVEALYDYVGQEGDELSFKKGM